MNTDIKKFILQSQTKNLKTSSYPKDFSDFDVKFSFGMGTPAKISWVSVHNQEIRSTKGINCVYLYYKEENILVLAYGIMENFVDNDTWPNEIKESNKTINEYFSQNLDSKPYRYGSSYVFKVYSPIVKSDKVFFKYHNSELELSDKQFDNDINELVNQYAKVINVENKDDDS